MPPYATFSPFRCLLISRKHFRGSQTHLRNRIFDSSHKNIELARAHALQHDAVARYTTINRFCTHQRAVKQCSLQELQVDTHLTGNVLSPFLLSISRCGTGYQRKFSFQLKPPYVMSDPTMNSKVSSLMTSIMGQTTVELGRYLRVKLQQGMNAWGATCEKHARAKEQVRKSNKYAHNALDLP